MKLEDIVKNIKNRNFSPVYFLTGEQSYYIDRISDMLENDVLEESEKDFNLIVRYGLDVSANDILYQSRQYPMLSTYQVVIIKEAQNVKKIEELESYIDNPTPSTILVLCYKYNKLDGRTSFAKKIKTKTVYYETPKIYDNQIPDWIIKYSERKGYTMKYHTALLLGSYIGTDLQKIANQIDKLCIALPNRNTINESDIEKHIGISKDFNVFELQEALGSKNFYKAQQIAMYFAENEKAGPMPMIISVLYGFFAKVMRYHFIADKSQANMAKVLGVPISFVKDYSTAANNYPARKISAIFSMIEEYDLKAKGVNNVSTTQGELVKELVINILNL